MATQDEFERAVTEGIEVSLSTGRLVQFRIAELTRFVENGEVPNALLPLVYRELYGDDDPPSLEERNKRYLDSLRVAGWVTENVLKKPIKGLFNSEIFEIYGLAINPAKALTRFRMQQASHVRDGELLPEVGTDTEPAPQN